MVNLFSDALHRRSQDVSKGGGVTLRQIENSPFLGYLVKNACKRGGYGHPRTPPWLRPCINACQI